MPLAQLPSTDCLRSLGESRESLYPYTGATTNFQSSLGVLLLLRQSPSPAAKIPYTQSLYVRQSCLHG